MPPRARHLTLASASFIAMALATTPLAIAQDTPAAAPPAAQPEAAAPAQPAAPDPLQARVAELEAQLAQRTQELAQSLAEASQARDAGTQEVATRDQRIAGLEQDLAAAKQTLSEQAAERERLNADLQETAGARDRLQAYAVDRTKLLEQANRDVRTSADRADALQRDLDAARQQAATAQQLASDRQGEFAQAAQRAEMLEAARSDLEQQLAGVIQARDQRIAALEASLVKPASGPTTIGVAQDMSPVEGPRAPCLPLALRFDRAHSRAMSAGVASEKLGRASEMRNQAMETCNAGKPRSGQRQLRQAIAALSE